MKVAIVTDSNAGITQKEAESIENLRVLPMPFTIEGEEYFEDINLSQEEFYKKLLDEDASISTSQPSIASVTEIWDELLKEYDQVVHIPMSSGLSMSCETATNFAKEYDGKVFVVNNRRISVTQKQSVYDALKLAAEGKDGKEIEKILVETSMDSSIYIMVSTLKYLKRGGRVTPAAAAIGTLLKIKPVLQIQGGKLDTYAKVMNEKVARLKMIEAAKHDLETRFKELYEKGEMRLAVAYTNCIDKANDFAQEIKNAIPNVDIISIDPLSLSVSCHIGSGALAVAVTRAL
ncbi:MAG: DegV family protein [Clostridia bacterium]|jgi:DegV family protein with EDD domain|nr:DegV family protein [Clostridia bacterium]